MEAVFFKPRIGVIGGSGLRQMDGLTDVRETFVPTPFGAASDPLILGRLGGVDVAFLTRQGRTHGLIPNQIPFRANIYALESVGVQYLLSVSAVGSMREDIAPLDMVLVDRFIDVTGTREGSFFGDGAVARVTLADPVCPVLQGVLREAFVDAGFKDISLHNGGTCACIEGPAMPTRAEALGYRRLGASVIGVTSMPEARLAREAEMAYATLALVTDWDCWHPQHARGTAEMAIADLRGIAQRAQVVLGHAVQRIAADWPISAAHSALASMLVAPPATGPRGRS